MNGVRRAAEMTGNGFRRVGIVTYFAGAFAVGLTSGVALVQAVANGWFMNRQAGPLFPVADELHMLAKWAADGANAGIDAAGLDVAPFEPGVVSEEAAGTITGTAGAMGVVAVHESAKRVFPNS